MRKVKNLLNELYGSIKVVSLIEHISRRVLIKTSENSLVYQFPLRIPAGGTKLKMFLCEVHSKMPGSTLLKKTVILKKGKSQSGE